VVARGTPGAHHEQVVTTPGRNHESPVPELGPAATVRLRGRDRVADRDGLGILHRRIFGIVLGVTLIVVGALASVTNFCIPSWIYNTVAARRSREGV
jgi:hypothetical protein